METPTATPPLLIDPTYDVAAIGPADPNNATDGNAEHGTNPELHADDGPAQ